MNKNTFADYAENKILDHVFGNTAFSAPATLYLALFTTLPNDAGSGGTEVSGGGYARKDITNNTTNFPNASGGVKSNGAAFTFSAATIPWGTIKGWGLYDASSAGNLIMKGLLRGAAQLFTASASTETITATAHGLSDGNKVLVFTDGGTLPGGLAEETEYYIIGSTANTFQLSTTSGGSAINLTTDGVGNNYVALSYWKTIDQNDIMTVPTSSVSISLD